MLHTFQPLLIIYKKPNCGVDLSGASSQNVSQRKFDLSFFMQQTHPAKPFFVFNFDFVPKYSDLVLDYRAKTNIELEPFFQKLFFFLEKNILGTHQTLRLGREGYI